MEIRLVKKEEINKVAEFIAQMNRGEQYVAYCADEKEVLIDDLIDGDFDIPFEETFVVLEDKGEIKVLIGFDCIVEDNDIDVWGPFVMEGYESYLDKLWNYLMDKIEMKVEAIQAFIAVENKLAQEFFSELGFKLNSSQKIFRLGSFDEKVEGDRLEDNDIEAFAKLHDSTFPNTYYNSKRILDVLGENNRIFVYKADGQVVGYVHVKREGLEQRGKVEHIGVREDYRKRGIAKKLLKQGLSWIFSDKGIKDIELCVNSSNKGAVNLYKALGFELNKDLLYLKLNY